MDKDKNLNRIKAVLAETACYQQMAGRAVGKVNLHCQQMVLAKNAAGFADHQSNFQIT